MNVKELNTLVETIVRKVLKEYSNFRTGDKVTGKSTAGRLVSGEVIDETGDYIYIVLKNGAVAKCLTKSVKKLTEQRLNENNKMENMIPDEMKKFYIKKSMKFNGDVESYTYSYRLKLPHEDNDTENYIKQFLKGYGIGVQYYSHPGGPFNNSVVSIDLVNKEYWDILVSGRGGLDI